MFHFICWLTSIISNTILCNYHCLITSVFISFFMRLCLFLYYNYCNQKEFKKIVQSLLFCFFNSFNLITGNLIDIRFYKNNIVFLPTHFLTWVRSYVNCHKKRENKESCRSASFFYTMLVHVSRKMRCK